MPPHRVTALVVATAAVAALAAVHVRAHKPITSPFTYNEDVYPILSARCGGCHAPGAVAPMSLLTHEDAVPWGESIRVELLAGHMPPWGVDSAPGRFRNVEPITARELNVLLTWASGGTPLGSPDRAPAAAVHTPRWHIGAPDLELPWPAPVELPDDVIERTAEFTIPTGLAERRWVRAVDLLPGTPSIVRWATVHAEVEEERSPALPRERLLALWVAGDTAANASEGTAFELPAGATLRVRVHYRKTWQNERDTMRDRSTLGLYFATAAVEPIDALMIEPAKPADELARRQTWRTVVAEDVRALAVYPGARAHGAEIAITAVTADGARQPLLVFRPRAGWARRYWLKDPVVLPRGTTIETTVAVDDEATVAAATSGSGTSAVLEREALGLVLNVVPVHPAP